MKPNLTYFEFGSGGSTNIASYYKLKEYSVESDVLWHNKLKKSNISATLITVDLKVNTKLGLSSQSAKRLFQGKGKTLLFLGKSFHLNFFKNYLYNNEKCICQAKKKLL